MNRIKEHHLSFCVPTNGEHKAHIWDLLDNGLWKQADFSVFEENTKLGELKRKHWKPFLPNVLPVFYGMVWSQTKKQMTEPYFVPTIQATEQKDFIEASQQFFNSFSGKHIGVQLSGGLDSSLIISLLQHLKIPFSLVGMTTDRYEFRTEKHIQSLYALYGKETVLLDYENYLPFTDLEVVPSHQYPDLLSANYAANKAMALECQKLGIEVLLTGNGGDNVFAEPISENPQECTWLPKGFTDGWLNDLVYAPYEIEVVPFYADKGILNTLYNLRLGEKEDNSKLWARNFFKDLLPQELTNYTYCADFWGLYVDGLLNAMPYIKELFKNAYRLTNNAYFSEERINKLLSQDLLNTKKTMYQEIEATIALAVWLKALQK